jgi:nucleoside-diphosphate-sugar epimerase
MLEARPQFASQLDFVQIEDFEKIGVFDEAVKEVDAVIHVASVRFPPESKKLPRSKACC